MLGDVVHPHAGAAHAAPALYNPFSGYPISDGWQEHLNRGSLGGIEAADDTMLMAYLPKEKILLNADLYSPPAQGAQPPAAPTPGQKTLYQNMLKLSDIIIVI